MHFISSDTSVRRALRDLKGLKTMRTASHGHTWTDDRDVAPLAMKHACPVLSRGNATGAILLFVIRFGTLSRQQSVERWHVSRRQESGVTKIL